MDITKIIFQILAYACIGVSLAAAGIFVVGLLSNNGSLKKNKTK